MAKPAHSGELFPILNQSSGDEPVGIARLAERSSDAGHGHNVTFRMLEARTILNKTVSRRRLSLAYSINPYRGCEFGCKYCYARYTHGFFAGPTTGGESSKAKVDYLDSTSFERMIFLKRNAAWLLEQELWHFESGQEIAIGTATDPYQPIERTAGITRSLLEVFSRRSGHRLGIVTKSRLIVRDAELLTRIARRNILTVHLTITTDDPNLARILEPRAPRPDLRFDAVRRLRAKGITTGVLCSPLLPGLTDSREQIAKMAGLATQAGASFFAAEPLFLKSCSRPTYLSFVREHFPHLAQEYAKRFAQRDFADRHYRDRLQHDVREACSQYGVPHRSTDALLTRDAGESGFVPRSAPRQASLFA